MKTQREIKFRGFDKVNKRMFEVYGLGVDWVTENTMDGVNEGVNCWHGKDFSDNIEVMQFTGLKDKNGKSIYDGDILRDPVETDWDKINFGCFEVFFHDGDACSDYNIGFTMCRMHCHGSVCGGYIPPFKPKTTSTMVVIGNIYENQELIKN